jgi:hypothetical protein
MSPGDATGSADTQEHLPFHSDIPPAQSSESAASVAPDAKLAANVPFRTRVRPQTLPVGTLLTVALDNSLSAASVHAGDVFAASVAAPLVFEGRTVVERGAEVTGRIEGAQSLHGSGYVELTLSAIRVEGTQLPLQTSSLFARGSTRKMGVSSIGNPAKQVLGGVRIPKGRRLTFRLSAPITLGEVTQEARQAAKKSTE